MLRQQAASMWLLLALVLACLLPCAQAKPPFGPPFDPPNDFQAPQFCPDEEPRVEPDTCGRRLDVNHDLTSPERAELAGYLKEYLTTQVIEDHMYQGEHGNAKFFPWHRAYIKGVENYIASQKDLTSYLLPKWNPQNPIPPEFCGIDPDCPGNCPKLSNLDPNFPRPPPLKDVNEDCEDDYTSLEHLRTGDVGAFVLCSFPLQWNGLVGLEPWHGCVHVLVGGTMGNTAISPGAVLFMLWHAFVDDIVYCWQCVCDKSPTTGNCLDITLPPGEPDGCLNQLEAVVMELPKYYNLTNDAFMRQVEEAQDLYEEESRENVKEVIKILRAIQRQAEFLKHKDRANGYPYHLVEEKSRRCISEISGKPQKLRRRGHKNTSLSKDDDDNDSNSREEHDRSIGRPPP